MKKIFTLFAAMLFAASTWAANLPAGNYVYFEKPNDWSAVSLLLGHSSYSIGYNMTSIANTNLYYWKTDKWDGYTEYAFIDANGWGGESGNNAKPSTRKEWATHKTAAFTTTIAKYHLFTSAGSKSSHASSFETAVNRTQTIQIQVKDGENWVNATTAPATVTATTYALTSASATTKQTASITVAGATTSATLSAAYSATVTLEYIDLAEGYMFVGWFNANGQQISNYTVTDAATVYARFEESAEETNNVTVSYVCNSVSLKESTSLTVGTKTASRVEAPAIDDYIFQSWTLSAGVESADATANPIYITTKTGETEYTLTANYIEVPKVTVYAINSSKWEAIAVHHWAKSGSSTAWPGDLMTKTELQDKNGFDVYSATFVAEHDSCIFNNNGKGAQTKNLTVENGKYYDVKGQQWYASLDEVPFVDPLATNIYLAGGMNEWNDTTTMFKKATADATSASVTLALEAQTYEFKVVVDGQWYGNNGTMTREYHEGWTFRVKQDNGETDEINAKITADIAGDYTFTWNMTENKLTVTYPELPAPHVTLHKVLVGEDLQAVVSQALSGDTVLVQAGTYEGNFTMVDGVFVSGGWNADFTEQTQHASILDAKANGRVLNQPADFTTLTIWDNFTIQNGKLSAADGSKSLGAGVALWKKGRVINCLIQNNTFEYSGNCIGGGIGHDSGDKNDTCAINCIVRNNTASHGGGVRIRGVILNSIIEGNTTTTNAAGGMHLQGGAAYNCIIRNNESLLNTGGVRCYGACELVNCLVVGNKAGGKVGGVGCESKPSNIINCTIVENEQVNTGSDAVFCGLSDGIGDTNAHNGKFFVNNIIWGNKAGGEVQTVQANSHIKRYSTFKNNALSDTTNLGKEYFALNADNAAANGPRFNEDYSFATTSPLYNAGTNDALTYFVGDKDVYGNARKQGENIEIGAVEIAEPSYEKYSLIATGIKAENETVEGISVIKLKGEGYLNGEEAVPFEFMVFESMMGYGAEGTIGEINVFSTEAEFFAEEGEFLLMATMQDEEGKYLFNVEVRGTMPKAEVEIVVKETKDVTLYNLNLDVQGNMAMVTADNMTLSFNLTLLDTENYYGTYTNDAFSNIWYGDDQLYAAYGEAQVYAEVDGKAKFVVSFISTPDAEGNVTLYNFTLYAGEQTATGVENLDTTVAPVKMIENGQLIIMKGDTKYNAQGAVVK